MSAGKTYLMFVTEKIKDKLQEVNLSISEGRKEIEDMHEYYWENYTEMDQYGYENFDNQQALLHQVNANQEQLSMKHRLERMLEAPFFGRVDFCYEGEEEAESFYIGIGNFAAKAGQVPLIYDWRAPVSGLFYDFDKGLAWYDAPAGRLEGEVTAKWQYKIKKGTMVYEFESDVKIDDDILKAELGSNGDVQLKNIVRTIQKEQNAIIRNTKDKILVIQGAAGSGKTSVALHRIAYLLYHDRKGMKSSNILILSPNSVFSDYISHILPELGEEHIQEMSFDLFAYRELKSVFLDCEDRYDQMERDLRVPFCYAGKWKEKQTEAFLGEMEAFLAGLEDSLMNFKDISFKSMTLTEREMVQLFYFKFQEIPLLSRMQAVQEYFIDAYETLYDCHLSDEDMEEIAEKFRSMYATKDLYVIYNWFLKEAGYETLPEVSAEKRILKYEDVYPMLYLKYRLWQRQKQKTIKHLVIDEMQDYSYLQYVILKELFPCRMTILGDRAQTMEGEWQEVHKFLPKIFGKHLRTIEMKKSYRNTVEIAAYAQNLIGVSDLELFERHGKAVEEEVFAEKEEAWKHLLENLDFQTYETAAILTMTQEEALEIYEALKEQVSALSYLDRDSRTFQKGLTVTTFYLAKGLEFDQVFTMCHQEQTPLLKQAEYICATRALHELYMYCIKL